MCAVSESAHQCLELVAAVLHVLEEVEAGTAGAQQYRVARLCHARTGCHTVFHATCVLDGESQAIESSVELGIVDTQEHQCSALLLHQWDDGV